MGTKKCKFQQSNWKVKNISCLFSHGIIYQCSTFLSTHAVLQITAMSTNKINSRGKNSTKNNIWLLFLNHLMLSVPCDKGFLSTSWQVVRSAIYVDKIYDVHLTKQFYGLCISLFLILIQKGWRSTWEKCVHPRLLCCCVYFPSHCVILVFMAL